MGITSLQGLSVLIDNEHLTRSLSKLQQVIAHASHQTGQGGHIRSGEELGLTVGSRTKVDTFLQHLFGSHIPLQLSTPQSTIVAIHLSIVVLEHTGIDAVGTTDGMLLSNERTLGTVGNSHAEMEHAIIVLGREDEVVLAVLLDDIAVPHLLLGPFHILHIENHTVVGGIAVLHIIERQHMVVLHLEVATVIVEGCTCLPVVRGVDVELAVKHMGRRIGHIVTGKKIPCFHNLLFLVICKS